MSDQTSRPDFSKEQIEFCEHLSKYTDQTKKLYNIVYKLRLEQFDSMWPEEKSTLDLCELETILRSYSEIYGGYWTDMDVYYSYEDFVNRALGYLNNTLGADIAKLKESNKPREAYVEDMIKDFGSYHPNYLESLIIRTETINKMFVSVMEAGLELVKSTEKAKPKKMKTIKANDGNTEYIQIHDKPLVQFFPELREIIIDDAIVKIERSDSNRILKFMLEEIPKVWSSKELGSAVGVSMKAVSNAHAELVKIEIDDFSLLGNSQAGQWKLNEKLHYIDRKLSEINSKKRFTE